MNLLQIKYALEIARTHSINKASESLFVGQSALSRAMKELEASLGTAIFERSAKGMFLTPAGEIFIRHAQSLLKQAEALENLFSTEIRRQKRFSVSAPRVGYITAAFAHFSKQLKPDESVEIFYQETDTLQVLKNVLQETCKLGILHYTEQYDNYYKSMLEEKGLAYELIAEFEERLVLSKSHPLAKKTSILQEDLQPFTEVELADSFVPALPPDEDKLPESMSFSLRRIHVFEQESLLTLLSQNPQTYAFLSPLPEDTLARYSLTQIGCEFRKNRCRNLLIHRKDYRLSETDHLFIQSLIDSKRALTAML